MEAARIIEWWESTTASGPICVDPTGERRRTSLMKSWRKEMRRAHPDGLSVATKGDSLMFFVDGEQASGWLKPPTHCSHD